MVTMSITDIVAVYVHILAYSIPIAMVFGLSNIAVDTILTAAFGGGIKIGGRK